MTTPAIRRALELHPALASLGQFAEAEERALWRERALIRASISDRTWPEKVKAFRALYNLNRFNAQLPAPTMGLRAQLHRGLHAEEFGEAMGWSEERRKELVHEARDTAPEGSITFDDFVEQVDGRLDLIYTLLGELDEMGFAPWQVDTMFAEVHASNMTKVDTLGQPVYDENGKVQKGDNYVPADIAGLIRAFAFGEVNETYLTSGADDPEEARNG